MSWTRTYDGVEPQRINKWLGQSGVCSRREAEGLISKHFIWSESGIAGGVYKWRSREEAEAFYGGPWGQGIIDRYGMPAEIEYFTVFAITDNEEGTVKVLEAPRESEAA